jgi:hypothetical protein
MSQVWQAISHSRAGAAAQRFLHGAVHLWWRFVVAHAVIDLHATYLSNHARDSGNRFAEGNPSGSAISHRSGLR